MKNILLKFIFLLTGFVLIFSCEKREFVTLNHDAKIQAQLSVDQLVLADSLADDDVLTVSWEKPDVGFQAAISYSILLDVAGNGFASAQSVSAGTELSYTFKGEELNNKLLTLGLQAGQPADVEIKVVGKLSDSKSVSSQVMNLQVTPYSSVLDLSTEWGVVGSATPGGWSGSPIPDLPFYRTSTQGVIVAYVRLKSGEIKFRKNNDWTENYGDNGGDGTLDANGANIPVSAGHYKITLDFNNMTYTIEPYFWGIVGSATPGGWNGPDLALHYNPYGDNWKAAVTLDNGEIKFRLNNDWTTNFGDDGADGTLDANGANIPVTAGNYIITVDFNHGTYTIEPRDLWGLVGSATPNGWNGPDIKFLPDFGTHPGRWYLNGVDLSAGEVKIRLNDDWANNYGDDGNDGTLEANGANIPVNAGTYNITVDFSVSPPTIEILAWQ